MSSIGRLAELIGALSATDPDAGQETRIALRSGRSLVDSQQRLACDLGQLKADGPTGFPLADSCSVDRVPVGRNIVHTERHEFAATQPLSIARLNMARSRLRRSSCNFARIDHTWPGLNGGFGPVSLPLFLAGRRGLAICDVKLLSYMVGRLIPACDGRRQLVGYTAASELDLP